MMWPCPYQRRGRTPGNGPACAGNLRPLTMAKRKPQPQPQRETAIMRTCPKCKAKAGKPCRGLYEGEYHMARRQPTPAPTFNPLSRKCPKCGAGRGEPCHAKRKDTFHIGRHQRPVPRASAKPPWTPEPGRKGYYPTLEDGQSVRAVPGGQFESNRRKH